MRAKADDEIVRAVLADLLAATGGPVRRRVKAAAEAFERLHPAPVGGAVIVTHTWCVCGHEHDTYTADNAPVSECHWVFCKCARFAPRSLAPPPEEEVERLRAALNRDWEAHHARRRAKAR